jgi:hypothetical protein
MVLASGIRAAVGDLWRGDHGWWLIDSTSQLPEVVVADTVEVTP